jgi:hypothetical protein
MAATWSTGYWGQNNWGDQADVDVVVTGSPLTSSIGDSSVTAELNAGWGRNEWGSMAWGVPYSTVVSGISLSTAITGVVATADVEVLVSSFLLSTAIGDEGTEGNASVQLESLSLSVSIGPVEAIIIQGSQMTTGTGLVDIQAGGNIYIQVDEHTITTSAGQVSC